MAEVEFYFGRREFNEIIEDMAKPSVREHGEDVERLADALLEEARATTQWEKIHPETSPEHVTRVTGGVAGNGDYLVHLEGLSPESIEYGHSPSGVFGPTGSLGHVKTKAPEGLYILGRASGLAG